MPTLNKLILYMKLVCRSGFFPLIYLSNKRFSPGGKELRRIRRLDASQTLEERYELFIFFQVDRRKNELH
jgi:hypothetical protein